MHSAANAQESTQPSYNAEQRQPPITLAAHDRDRTSADADDLDREVYCIIGAPIDAIDLPTTLRCLHAAADAARPFLISTVNANFLVSCQTDLEFARSLHQSNLCVADGAPIVWFARWLGAPIKERVAGSDVFGALKVADLRSRPLSVFLFGGAGDVAARACVSLNASLGGLRCSGWINPGFGSVEEMSRDELIDQINASGADFLVAGLGAKKGQYWLIRNHNRLRIPIRSHFGAALNFEAGTIRRAPKTFQKYGLEWVWRIFEEPYLWRRYWSDSQILIRLLFMHVLPLAIWMRYFRSTTRCHDLAVEQIMEDDSVTLRLAGSATKECVAKATPFFRSALTCNKNILIDLTEARFIDCRFFGLLLMLRKHVDALGRTLKLSGVSPRLARLFRLNGVRAMLLN